MSAAEHTYAVSASYSASALGYASLTRPWSEVESWFIKWDELHVTYKDGTEEVADLVSEIDTDTKRPSGAEILPLDPSGDPLWGHELDQF